MCLLRKLSLSVCLVKPHQFTIHRAKGARVESELNCLLIAAIWEGGILSEALSDLLSVHIAVIILPADA